ncbi:hypothetical protein PV04_00319 [Phialophora macrospora]|uniref:Zn(2)-C6 fungal-type domain-containing protein n=1 Tax=Phialophora macrospora TaxID=1851006 RepID=A0A0D2GID3_9EURO|nr:hypothetical protein PV04_00319 [Phialophora macrospora]
MADLVPVFPSVIAGSEAGCRTCKVRRIKCDRGLPACHRCVKSRRVCVKARAKSGGLAIQVENRYASGVVKRPRGPRSSLLPALDFDLQSRALVYYLNYHLHTPAEVQKLVGNVQNSVCQWASHTTNSLIDLAISSMALAVFSRTQHHQAAATEAREKYNHLLRTARVGLPNLVERDVDAALLAIFLMSRYEDSMHAPEEVLSTTAFRSYGHHDGATAILKIWHENSLKIIQPASDIIKHSRRGIIRSCILRQMPVPAWLADGAHFGEYGLELEYDQLVVGVASIRHQFKTLQRERLLHHHRSQEVYLRGRDLNTEADALSQALQDWSTRLPSTWCPRRHLIPADVTLPRRHFFSSIVYSYSSVAHAALWLNYFATMMLLNRVRLRILVLIRPASDDLAGEQQRQEEVCCSQIRVMADALSSSIPFALDRFAVASSSKTPGEEEWILSSDEEIKPYLGYLTAWPLSIASSIGGLEGELKDWLRSELALVGRTLGVGVLECAQSYDWLEF